jgi:hypothetical protein
MIIVPLISAVLNYRFNLRKDQNMHQLTTADVSLPLIAFKADR